MGEQELKDILEKHRKWVRSEEGGVRANLYGANLYGANLTRANLDGANLYGANLYGANLTRANLYGANLDGANLYGANLYGANLTRANLDGANLDGANLTRANLDGANLYGANLTRANLYGANLYGVRTDFFAKLAMAKDEVAGLYDALMRGRVDGSCYEGECACFVGTIANVRGEKYDELTNGLKPESESATECWFLAIRKGDVPSSNQVAEITRKWIEEFANESGIALPKYRLISSAEFPEAF